MLKKTFRFVVLGVGALVAAKSAWAQSYELPAGGQAPAAQVAPVSAMESLAWIDQQNLDHAVAGSVGGSCGNDINYCCDECVGNWRDNTELWVGFDAYKSIGDMTILALPSPLALTNSAGAVAGFNTGLGLGDSAVRFQVGASFGAYDFKGRTTLPPTTDDSLEQQTYVTFGFYKRSDVCHGDRISAGLVYDQFFGHQWGWQANEVYLSQVRGILGFALNECNEVGVWGTVHTNVDDDVAIDVIGPPLTVRAMNQANAYLRHNWAFGANSLLYVGAFDQADIASWQLGMLNTAPLNHSVSLYANFNYVVPGAATGIVGAAEEQWNASVGLAFSLGGKAVSPTVSGNRGLPLLPVANNGSFLITN